jgi:membrane protease YdiL (CAAX protease family)
MNIRRKMLFFGWITLLVFPIPAFVFRHYYEQLSFLDFIQIEKLELLPIGLGLEFGFVYAFICYLIMKAPFFDRVPTKIDSIIAQMNLKVRDGIFLSICAGVGEELLFRSGVQTYFGWQITSVLFVALHGYLNPWNWRFSVYGLLVLPFIFLISLGFYKFGLWFAIAAHFSYDAVLFTIMIQEKRSESIH